jgi:UV DNA damage endonuclease
MRIGYACLTRGIPYTDLRGTIQKNATEEKLIEIISHNLKSLDRMLEYNREAGIQMLRISSDLIPFGSSPVNSLEWDKIFQEEFQSLGAKLKTYGIRASMHPGQYTVINSPRPEVVERAVLDLEYHVKLLQALGTDNTSKIILHIGGVYGDKKSAMNSFSEAWDKLSDSVKARLIIENDDKSYTIEDIMEIGMKNGIPVVFDNLHHKVNGNNGTDAYWIRQASSAWKDVDGIQKIHYSQQDTEKSQGAHSVTIDIKTFLDFIEEVGDMDYDIMLEVKDKNLSAVKAVNALNKTGIVSLEKEWSRYKYSILERSQEHYFDIRQLLKDKTSYPVVDFYELLDEGMSVPPTNGTALNAMEHVWGYFKYKADEKERGWYSKIIQTAYNEGFSIAAAKKKLWTMTEKYNETYLLNSYYFHL